LSKIKTKTTVRDIKALDKAGDVTHRAKNAYIRTKEQAEQTQQHSHDNYVEYAEDKVNEGAETAAIKTGQTVMNQGKEAIRDIRGRHRLNKEAERTEAPGENAQGQASQPGRSAAPEARDVGNRKIYPRQTEYPMRHKTTSASNQSDLAKRRFVQSKMVRTTNTGGKTIKDTAKGTIKSAHKSIKTAGHTAKATIKTSQTAIKTATKTAKTTTKAAQRAVQAARAAARAAASTAKAGAKATAAIVKTVVAAVKGLITLIAAGGWVAVAIILVICLVGLILGSAFGIFYSGEDTGTSLTMPQVVSEINSGFQAKIDGKIKSLSSGGSYDEIKIIYEGDADGDSTNVNNWTDVLTVFAVKYTGESMEVVTITPEKVDELRNIFNDMNKLSTRTETKTEETTIVGDDGEEETITHTTLIIYVKINSLTYEEGAAAYGFTAEQNKIADELMSPSYYSLYAELIGVDLLGGVDLTKIISNLPVGTEGAEVVKVALTKLGAPYVMGAKGDKKFDCSGLAYWAINQVDRELGAKMYTNAAGQAKWCISNGKAVGRSELQPGDLIFWQNLSCPGCGRWHEVHHVGIYVGDGKAIEASSSRGRVVVRELWSSAHYPLYAFARPYPTD
jgi:hypothetical protein